MTGLHERFDYPRWRGSALARRTLLVAREQGLGDEIMFASCFNELLDARRALLHHLHRRLQPLFARSFPKASFLSGSEADLRERLASEAVDFQLPAGSLPLCFAPPSGTFPRHAAICGADPSRIEHWRARLAELGERALDRPVVAGRLAQHRARRRSIALETLGPLLELPGHAIRQPAVWRRRRRARSARAQPWHPRRALARG